MEKFKVHKNCSCWACKSGKTKDKTKPVERAYRHKSKQDLHVLVEDFENTTSKSDYYD